MQSSNCVPQRPRSPVERLIMSSENSENRRFVTFELAERTYGLDIRTVKEVNPNTVITPVPLTQPEIRGLVNVRGLVVLVIDIAVVFGHERRPLTEDSQVIILKTTDEMRSVPELYNEFQIEKFGTKPVAFLADRIGEVVTVESDLIKPPPPHLTDTNTKYVEGVVALNQHLLVLLKATAML